MFMKSLFAVAALAVSGVAADSAAAVPGKMGETKLDTGAGHAKDNNVLDLTDDYFDSYALGEATHLPVFVKFYAPW